MSTRKKNGKSGMSIPSQAKVEELLHRFPDLSAEICEAILLSVDWNVDRAAKYLQDSHSPTPTLEEIRQEVGKEWPSLCVSSASAIELSNSYTNVHSPSFPSTSVNHKGSGSVWKSSGCLGTPSSSSCRPISSSKPYLESLKGNKSTLPCTAPVPVKDDWKPCLTDNVTKKIDRNVLRQALVEELKYKESGRILRLVGARPGVQIPNVVVIMRGVPGSGKSRLSELVVGVSDQGVICSADHHFMNQYGQYNFRPRELPLAHQKAQEKCSKLMSEGVTPIVIDNTNTQVREMLPYVKLAMNCGYNIEVLEPNTKWKRNCKTLFKKTLHGVPMNKIQDMLDRWDSNITPEKLLEIVWSGEEMSHQKYNKVQNTAFQQSISPTVCQNTKTSRANSAGETFVPSLISEIDLHKERSGFQNPSSASCSSTILNIAEDMSLLSFEEIQSRRWNTSSESNKSGQSINQGTVLSELNYDFNTPGYSKTRKSDSPCPNKTTTQDQYFRGESGFEDCVINSSDLSSWFSDDLSNGIVHQPFTPFDATRSTSENCLRQTATGFQMNDSNENDLMNCEQFRSHSVPPGFSKTTNQVEPSVPGSEEDLNQEKKNAPYKGDEELFTPLDGDDWFDLKLSPEFLTQAMSAYSDLESLSTSNLSPDIMNIRIPPNIAFDLFKLFSMNWMQQSGISSPEPGSMTDLSNNDIPDTEDDEVISQVLQMEEITSCPTPSLEKIMELEAKLSARDKVETKTHLSQIKSTLADKLKMDKLQSGFPTLSRSEIELTYARCRCVYNDALTTLKTMHPLKFVGISDSIDDGNTRKVGTSSIGSEMSEREPKVKSTFYNPNPIYVPKINNEENMSSSEWRTIASQHHLKKVEAQFNMKECIRKGSGGSDYFLQMVRHHTFQMQKANDKAKDLILKDLKAVHADSNILDLHHLYVAEAIDALDAYLKDRVRYVKSKMLKKLDLRIITGIGNNSHGNISRIIPAVLEYLKRKHLSFLELNGTIVVTLRYLETKQLES